MTTSEWAPAATHTLTGPLGVAANILIDVEQVHHTAGWDNTPPTLYRVCHIPGTITGYSVLPYRLGLLPDVHPRDELAAFAAGMETPAGVATVLSGYPGRPFIHLLVMEAWGRQFSGPAERAAETRMFADIPGSVELRTGIAIHGDTRVSLTRRRGTDPVLTVLPDAVDGGGMPSSLCRIHHRVTEAYAARMFRKDPST
jgi:hypothetical protein